MPEKAKDPSLRIKKISSLIQKEIGTILKEYTENEPGLITVTKAETSRDLKWVKVWISILGGDDDRILQALHKNIYDIQGALNQILPTKVLPRIQFFLDTSPRYAAHISEVIEQIHNEE